MLRAIAEALVEDGHDVSVLSSQPSYKARFKIPKQQSTELLNGVHVRRVQLLNEGSKNPLLRGINLLIFLCAIAWHILKSKRYDVVMASTAPAVMVGAVARLGARIKGSRFVYHCLDLHPEIGRISGHFTNPILYRLLMRIDTATCRFADNVVVLSNDMVSSVQSRQGCEHLENICVINNFSIPVFSGLAESNRAKLWPREDKVDAPFRLIFAGNVGRFQGLEALLDAFLRTRNGKNMELLFIGEGAALAALQAKVKSADARNVRFFPHQSVEVAKELIRDSDIGVVSLVPNIYKFAYPSKTMAYFELGKPIVTIVESGSELANLVRSRQVGYVAEPGDVQMISSVLDLAYEKRGMQEELSKNAVNLWAECFEQQAVLKRWVSLYGKLSKRAIA